MTTEGFIAPEATDLTRRLPGYEVIELVACGGMGAVYRARQTSLDRYVALKVLPPELAADDAFRGSFEAEAKAMAQLTHSNLIGVYDFGSVGDMLYLVMEFVEGNTLYRSGHDQAVDADVAIDLVKSVARGLGEAHKHGIVHRDIKPANILITPELVPKLGDFGLAVADSDVASGLMMGTPGYVAPEVLADPLAAGFASDTFALGVILYELLTGKSVEGGQAIDIEAVPTQDGLRELVQRATSAMIPMRFQDGSELADGPAKWEKNKAKQAGLAAGNTTAPTQTVVVYSGGRSGLLVAAVAAAGLAIGAFFFLRNGNEQIDEVAGAPGEQPVATETTPEAGMLDGIPPVSGSSDEAEPPLETPGTPPDAGTHDPGLHANLDMDDEEDGGSFQPPGQEDREEPESALAGNSAQLPEVVPGIEGSKEDHPGENKEVETGEPPDAEVAALQAKYRETLAKRIEPLVSGYLQVLEKAGHRYSSRGDETSRQRIDREIEWVRNLAWQDGRLTPELILEQAADVPVGEDPQQHLFLGEFRERYGKTREQYLSGLQKLRDERAPNGQSLTVIDCELEAMDPDAGIIDTRHVKLEAHETPGDRVAAIAELEILDRNGQALDRSDYQSPTCSSFSRFPGKSAGPKVVEAALDGDPATEWQSNFHDRPPFPHWIAVRLKETTEISGFRILPSQSQGRRAHIVKWVFLASEDGSTWREVARGTFPEGPEWNEHRGLKEAGTGGTRDQGPARPDAGPGG